MTLVHELAKGSATGTETRQVQAEVFGVREQVLVLELSGQMYVHLAFLQVFRVMQQN